jgi:hypothetical protein
MLGFVLSLLLLVELVKPKMKTKVIPKGKRFLGFNRNILFTGFTSFLTDTSVKMVYSVMPMFLLSIGASKTSLSLIEGIAESTAALIKTLSGFWSDKRQKCLYIIRIWISALIIPLIRLLSHPYRFSTFALSKGRQGHPHATV